VHVAEGRRRPTDNRTHPIAFGAQKPWGWSGDDVLYNQTNGFGYLPAHHKNLAGIPRTNRRTAMPTPTTWVYPKPKDWDEFENLVWDLFRRRWQDPDAQRYGRSGQEQHSVDVYGCPRDMGGAFVGVQCKRYEDENLTEKIISRSMRLPEMLCGHGFTAEG